MVHNKQILVFLMAILWGSFLKAQSLHGEPTLIEGSCHNFQIRLPLSIASQSPTGVGSGPVTLRFRMEDQSKKMYIQLDELCYKSLYRGQEPPPQHNSGVELAPAIAVQNPSRRDIRRAKRMVKNADYPPLDSPEQIPYLMPDDSTSGNETMSIDGQQVKVYWRDNIKERYNTYYQIDMVFEIGKDAYRLFARGPMKDKESLLQSVLSLNLAGN